jgi:hypothetical protein
MLYLEFSCVNLMLIESSIMPSHSYYQNLDRGDRIIGMDASIKTVLKPRFEDLRWDSNKYADIILSELRFSYSFSPLQHRHGDTPAPVFLDCEKVPDGKSDVILAHGSTHMISPLSKAHISKLSILPPCPTGTCLGAYFQRQSAIEQTPMLSSNLTRLRISLSTVSDASTLHHSPDRSLHQMAAFSRAPTIVHMSEALRHSNDVSRLVRLDAAEILE